MVIGILGLVRIHIDPTLAAWICTVCGTIATILAPANAPKPTVMHGVSSTTPPAG